MFIINIMSLKQQMLTHSWQTRFDMTAYAKYNAKSTYDENTLTQKSKSYFNNYGARYGGQAERRDTRESEFEHRRN